MIIFCISLLQTKRQLSLQFFAGVEVGLLCPDIANLYWQLCVGCCRNDIGVSNYCTHAGDVAFQRRSMRNGKKSRQVPLKQHISAL